MRSYVPLGVCGGGSLPKRMTMPPRVCERAESLLRHALPDFLLSFVNHVRYTYARTALPIPILVFCTPHRHTEGGDDL